MNFKSENAGRAPGVKTTVRQRQFNGSPVEKLLARLENPRQTSKGRWVCRCPSHDDKSPSMSIRVLDDKRVLLHCFAGCDVQSILESIGLEFSDLFPAKRIDHHVPRERALFDARDVLKCLSREVLVLLGASAKLLAGETLSQADFDRLQICAYRLLDAEKKTHA